MGRGRGRGGNATDTGGAQGRAFELRSAEELDAPTTTSILLTHGLPVIVVFNVGVTHSFISDAYGECLVRVLVLTEGTPFSIGLPDGSRVIGTHVMLCLSPLCRDLYVIC